MTVSLFFEKIRKIISDLEIDERADVAQLEQLLQNRAAEFAEVNLIYRVLLACDAHAASKYTAMVTELETVVLKLRESLERVTSSYRESKERIVSLATKNIDRLLERRRLQTCRKFRVRLWLAAGGASRQSSRGSVPMSDD